MVNPSPFLFPSLPIFRFPPTPYSLFLPPPSLPLSLSRGQPLSAAKGYGAIPGPAGPGGAQPPEPDGFGCIFSYKERALFLVISIKFYITKITT